MLANREYEMRRTVLVVEDNPVLLLDTVDTIEAAGFKVLSASNADTAMDVLESHSDIALVLTDIHMPGSMDGLELAALISKRWPPIDLIIASGYGKPSEEKIPPGGRFFRKPLQPQQMVRAIRERVG